MPEIVYSDSLICKSSSHLFQALSLAQRRLKDVEGRQLWATAIEITLLNQVGRKEDTLNKSRFSPEEQPLRKHMSEILYSALPICKSSSHSFQALSSAQRRLKDVEGRQSRATAIDITLLKNENAALQQQLDTAERLRKEARKMAAREQQMVTTAFYEVNMRYQK
jgi:hypothetical protein